MSVSWTSKNQVLSLKRFERCYKVHINDTETGIDAKFKVCSEVDDIPDKIKKFMRDVSRNEKMFDSAVMHEKICNQQ